MTASVRPLRQRLLVGASLATLTLAGTAHGQGNLGARRSADPAAAVAQAAQGAATRNAAAQAAAARTRAAFDQASRVRQQMDAAQAAARAAAQAARSNVPNGLGTGGLQVANGVAVDPTLWVGAKGPTQSQGRDGRTGVTVEQTQEKAILTWDSFNVGRETDLAFDHKGNTGWMTLNRVTSASADPTQILGSIKAAGSVYIINPNGVIFGGASQVNVRNLVASTLEIHGGAIEGERPLASGEPVSDAQWAALKRSARDQRFMSGLFGSIKQDSYAQYQGWLAFWDGVEASIAGVSSEEMLAEVRNAGSFEAPGITVAAGARIASTMSGSVILTGRNVTNEGSILSPDGQVILAAGRGLALLDGTARAIPSDQQPSRDVFKVPGFLAATTQGGETRNTGIIEATRGNVTLTGGLVRHAGLIRATTGVDKPGSVILDGSTRIQMDATQFRVPTDPVGGTYWGWGGKTVLENGSRIDVLPDSSEQTTVLSVSQFIPSQVEILGNQVQLQTGSTLWAPGANVRLVAGGIAANSFYNTDVGRLYIDKEATIDLAGLNGVEVDMEQNSIRAEFRANELADNPVVRDGALRGETVYFDARIPGNLVDGTGVANLRGWYDLVGRSVDQFLTRGGSLTLQGAEVITRQGSTIDLSGGSVRYNDGFVRRTKLIDPTGRLVPIEEAIAGVNYVGIEGESVVNHARWGVTERFSNPFSRVSQGEWQKGYDEGRSAGTLNLPAFHDQTSRPSVGGAQVGHDLARILEGDVRADTITGEYQTQAPTTPASNEPKYAEISRVWRERPKAATLSVGSLYHWNSANLVGGDITIADPGTRLGDDFTATSAVFDRDNGYASLVDGVMLNSHVLPTSWFDGKHFGNVMLAGGDGADFLYAADTSGKLTIKPGAPNAGLGGKLTIGAGVTVNLGDHGNFTFLGRRAEIDGRILSPGGEVFLEGNWQPKLTSYPLAPELVPQEFRPGVFLGKAAVIDVAGRWTNAWLEATNGASLTAPVVNGGRVTLFGQNVVLNAGSKIDVSGGAHLATDGGTLTLGNAGGIILDNDVGDVTGKVGTGKMVIEGTLLGHAPGKGGSLSINTSDELIIAEGWGDLAAIADGVLEAGTAAPKDVTLAAPLVISAGKPMPIDVSYNSKTLPPGVAVAEDSYISFNDFAQPLLLGADWTVPEGLSGVYDTNWNAFAPGTVVPAGTLVGYLDGTLFAGTKLSAEVFPNGITNNNDIALSAAAGAVFETDFTIPKGTTLAKGSTLDTAVAVENSFRLVSPGFFQAGGGASPPDDWGDLRNIADGVLEAGTAAPGAVRLTAPIVVPAGEPLPADSTVLRSTLPPDTPLAQSAQIGAADVTVHADWTVPNGLYGFDSAGNFWGADSVVPAGAVISIEGSLSAGVTLPTAAFPTGIVLRNPVSIPVLKGTIVADQGVAIAAGAVLDAGTVLASDAQIAFASRLTGEDHTHQGFANFTLSGARGLTVKSGSVIAPTVDTIELNGAVRSAASGTELLDLAGVGGSGVSLIRSTDLPEAQRQTTDLILATSGIDFASTSLSAYRSKIFFVGAGTYTGAPGTAVTLENGAAIHLTPESRVLLNSHANLFIDGTIETKGGEIALQQTESLASIRLGDNARLLAGGYQRADFDDQGYARRSVAAGGAIRIGGTYSEPGMMRLLIGAGSLLDVSGVSGFADLAGVEGGSTIRLDTPYAAIPVHGAGGSIDIKASEGVIAGEFRLGSSGERGQGGRLAISSRYAIRVAGGALDSAPVVEDSVIPADSLVISAERLTASRADDLALGYGPLVSWQDSGNLVFEGDVRLAARRSVILDSSGFAADAGAQVNVESAYVRLLGSVQADSATRPLSEAADGSAFTIRAGTIDVIDNAVLACADTSCGEGASAFARADFIADGDIRLIYARGSRGGLVAAGPINLTSAQTYAASGGGRNIDVGNDESQQYDALETDPGFLVRSVDAITVASNGAAAPVPLAFGAKLTLQAPEIVQAGTLRAPLGTIALEAQDRVDADGVRTAGRLTLAPGSLTSVSAEGVTQLAGMVSSRFNIVGYARADWAPSKAVVLSGGDVSVAGGATIDLAGGGDVLAWSFASGMGGITNILSDAGAFAVLPDYAGVLPVPVVGSIAPSLPGWNEASGGYGATGGGGTADSRLRVGDRVWLEAASGLKAGWYTLLPASYALLKGGHLVKPVDSVAAAGAHAAQVRDDGSVVVSGYRGVSGTAIRDPHWSSFQVLDAATWQKYSAITSYSLNAIRSATNATSSVYVRTPSDAGRLRIDALDSVSLLGDVRLSGNKGLTGEVDVSRPGGGIAIVNAGQAAPDGYLVVDAKQIQKFGAGGSLLIGGKRPITTAVDGSSGEPASAPKGLVLTTTASDVLVGDGVSLSGLELLLAATDSITVGAGATLTASGTERTNQSRLLLADDGALLRLSSGDRVAMVRTGAAGQSGSLILGAGSVLTTQGALSLDASAGFDLAEDTRLDVGKLDLGADRIVIGDAPAEVAGTRLSLETIERLGSASDLLLRAAESIGFYGDLALGMREADGRATLGALSFDTPLLQGHSAAGGGLLLTAGTLTLTNSGSGVTTMSDRQGGALTLDVDRLVLGDGAAAIGGFESVVGKAGDLRAEGSGSLAIDGDLRLAAGRVAVVTGADHAILAKGALALTKGAFAGDAGLDALIGGKLSLTGASLSFDTAAVARAGSLALEATGGDLTLGANAAINVTGVRREFRDTERFAPGGVVRLLATGSISTDAGSLIDLSGHARGGNAGLLEVAADGAAALGGALKADHAGGFDGGEFALDAATTDFSGLNRELNAAGFTAARDIRLRAQAIDLAAGERLEAHRVSLRSDSGGVTVAGTIAAGGDATTPEGGVVLLTGRDVTLASTGRIEAATAAVAATDFQPASGTVTLAADEGRVILASGSSIDVSGGRETGGRVIVRAARDSGAELSGTVTGAREKSVIGMTVLSADTVDGSDILPLLGGWNPAVAAGWEVGTGVLVRSDGDLNVTGDIDLSGVDGVGYLGFEAAGDIVIGANISDGFDGALADAELEGGKSFHYGFEAGRDLKLGEQVQPLPAAFIAPGQVLFEPVDIGAAFPLSTAGIWELPAELVVTLSNGQQYRGAWGQSVPGGSIVSSVFGSLPEGYSLPSTVFPRGLTVPGGFPAFAGEGRIVRTGTGDIRVDAGRDVLLGSASTIYTAGSRTATAPGFDRSPYVGTKVEPEDRVLGEFPTEGGNLALSAGRDIRAPIVDQSSSAWLFRYGAATWNGAPGDTAVIRQTNWSVVYRNFQYSLGALGGGNVSARAGRDVLDLSIALPSTGHLTTAVNERPLFSDLVVRGGGDLAVRALGDIGGGVFALGRGRAELIAGGSVTGGETTRVVDGNPFQFGGESFVRRGLAPMFGLMDATVDIAAAGGIELENAHDLGFVPQICENMVGACTPGSDNSPTVGSAEGAAWVAYSDRAAINAVAAGGDFLFRSNPFLAASIARDSLNPAFRVRMPQHPWQSGPSPVGYMNVLARLPGQVRFAAMNGDLIVQPPQGLQQQPILSAAPRGTLEWLASGGIVFDRTPMGEGGTTTWVIDVEDRAPEYMRNALAPAAAIGQQSVEIPAIDTDVVNATVGNNMYRGYDLLRGQDPDPLRLYALGGSIGISADTQYYFNWGVNTPKPLNIYAGLDIVNPRLRITHNKNTDASTIVAGRNVYNRNSQQGVIIYGPGQLWVEAGNSVLHPEGTSTIASFGNGSARGDIFMGRRSINYALADVGADINIVAGTAQGSNAGAFADQYLDPSNLANLEFGLSHPTNAGKVVKTYEKELEDFLQDRGFAEVTADNRRELFDTLPEEVRAGFLQQVLLRELQQTGVDYNDPEGQRFQQYTRGYDALHLLYPGTAELEGKLNPLGGNIELNSTAVETLSGGTINLIAPYGQIAIGNPADSTGGGGGIITRRGGNVNLLANGTISLALSRAFTLQGGDLLMWTSQGDITAGAGAKTNVTALPLSFLLDKNGLMSVNVFGLQTGAGIGVLDAFEGRDPDRRPSRMDLLAFFGEVNAGDAGIRVVGDINIAALRVVNAANIEVTGDAVGIPQIPVVNVGALNAASSATAAVVNQATQLAERSRPQIRTEMPTILNVRFLGFGE